MRFYRGICQLTVFKTALLRCFTYLYCIFLSSCTADDPIGHDSPQTGAYRLKLSVALITTAIEGNTWLDFEINDPEGLHHAVAAYYKDSLIGKGFIYSRDENGTIKGKLELDTYIIPSNGVIKVKGSNDDHGSDSLNITVSVIQRAKQRLLSSAQGGIIPTGYDEITDGITLADGSEWFTTQAGVLVINPDLSARTIPFKGFYQPVPQHIIVDNTGNLRFINVSGTIFSLDNNEFNKIGEIPNDNFNPKLAEVIYVEGYYYSIYSNGPASITKYDLITNTAEVYGKDNSTSLGRGLCRGEGNDILALFSSSSGLVLKLSGSQLTQFQFSASSSNIFYGAIYMDRLNRIWVGYGTELFQFSGSAFNKIEIPEVKYSIVYGDCINEGSIRKILMDQQGDLWIAKGCGVLKYDFNNFSALQSTLLTDQFKSGGSELSNVKNIFPGIDGGIFIYAYCDIGNMMIHLGRGVIQVDTNQNPGN